MLKCGVFLVCLVLGIIFWITGFTNNMSRPTKLSTKCLQCGQWTIWAGSGLNLFRTNVDGSRHDCVTPTIPPTEGMTPNVHDREHDRGEWLKHPKDAA